jgi:hypothetical protein
MLSVLFALGYFSDMKLLIILTWVKTQVDLELQSFLHASHVTVMTGASCHSQLVG